ncbi:MAG TPA: hypothetical protein VHP34_11515 [Alphaproteobacteria bacterium]|nr:hypothetical protein [Alphaproteobacteria bacterium]
MKIANLPANKFPIPFANSAGVGYINSIPVPSQSGITPGAASLTDGFPPATFLPVGSGGTPPFGKDFNGLLNQVTQWTKWQNAGGLVPYDSAYSTSIGGYPQAAVLAGATAGAVWLSTIDDNTNNPNTGGSGWVNVGTSSAIQTNQYIYAAAGGTANAITATLAPGPTSLVAGMSILILIASPITSTTVTLNLNGLGAKQIYRLNANNLTVSDILPGFIELIYDGSYWRLMGLPIMATNLGANGAIPIQGGLTMQWGVGAFVPGDNGKKTVSFPQAFSGAPLAATAVDAAASSWSSSNATFMGVANQTATTIQVCSINWNGSSFTTGTSAAFSYMVIGPT